MANQQNVSVSAENFIKAWQSSKTVDDVVEALGVTYKYAVGRATYLRRKGVSLKRFRTRDNLDLKSLNELAKKSLKN